MDMTGILSALSGALILMLKLSAPILILSMLVGLVIAVFQAATQIHEQTLTFVPKLFVIVVVLLVAGNWMITNLQSFMDDIFAMMLNL
ncbi:MAG: flagellar biosynthesis protein FliQ [Anaerovoracaceae bacterium]